MIDSAGVFRSIAKCIIMLRAHAPHVGVDDAHTSVNAFSELCITGH